MIRIATATELLDDKIGKKALFNPILKFFQDQNPMVCVVVLANEKDIKQQYLSDPESALIKHHLQGHITCS